MLSPSERVFGLRFDQLTALHLGVMALILVSVGRVHDHVGPLAALRPGLILTALCLVAFLLRPSGARVSPAFSVLPVRLLSLLAGVICVSAVMGLSIGASGNFILTSLIPVFFLFGFIVFSVQSVDALKGMVWAMMMAVFAVAFTSVFLSDAIHFDGYRRLGGAGMYDGNDIGVVFLTGVPLALAIVASRGWMSRVMSVMAIGLALTALLLAASRGGFIGLIVGGSAMLVLTPGWSPVRKTCVAVAIVVGVLALAPDGYWQLMASLLEPTADYNVTSETGRVAIWTRGLGYVAQFPVLGVGPDNFIRAGWMISDIGQVGLAGVGLRDQVAHNTFLQVWAELGTVGLLVWLAIIGTGIVAPLKLRTRFPSWWLKHGTTDQRFLYLLSSYLPAAYIGFSVTSFFVTHAYTSIFYALTGICAGFLIVSERELRSLKQARRHMHGGGYRTSGVENASRSPARSARIEGFRNVNRRNVRSSVSR